MKKKYDGVGEICMLHVNDLINVQKCTRFCWNHQYKKIPFEGFYHMDVSFFDLWKEYLGYETYGLGMVGDTNERTLELLKENDVVYQARMEYRELRIRIPVLIKIKGGYRSVYPHLSAFPKENDAVVMKINDTVAKTLGIDIIDHEIIYLNKDYIREDSLDLRQCLLHANQFFNRRNRLNKTIQECIDALDFDLDEWIDTTKAILAQEEPEAIRTKKCTANRKCIYYDDCFDESQEPDDSILFLTTSRYKFEAYYEGIKRVKDLPIEKLEGFRLQYSQYMASLHGKFIDHIALHSWLKNVQYPISYLDFEWDTFAIPPYKGMKPFDVLCFQYSLHVEEKGQEIEHFDFFDHGDCREAFIQSLLKQIPKKGTILVYNMEGAEKLRLQQLAEQFPQYKEALEQVWKRMVDLSKPFEAGIIYDNKMRGHYSLKSILPVFTDEYSYSDLSISNGLNAVKAYRTFESADEATQQEIRNDIRTYCSMDTFAEYIVYHGLLEMDKEEY